ncbi:MAG: preprotein translocase subunit YajC [Bacteroidales bacterium]|nr:preprotein translocase subunit YajC [Bacteroidales bacterium]
MNLLNIILFAQGASQSGAKGGMQWQSIVFLLLIIVIFYFFMIRPQSKKNKEIQKFRESLRKGDKVVTIGGIHGKIIEIDGNIVVIEVEGGGKLKVEKSAIAQNVNEIGTSTTK